MKCVIVVGCHRSGTSATAGVLHHLGVHMGDKLLGGDRVSNPLGHFECSELVGINRNVIGMDWRQPRSVDPAKALVNRYLIYAEKRADGRHEVWGVKDPRLCFTVGLMVKAVQAYEVMPIVLCVDRDRQAIVDSLQRRGGLKGVSADSIVSRYLDARSSAVEKLDGVQVERIDYDDLVTYPKMVVVNLVGVLSLGSPEKAVDQAAAFVDPELRHNKPLSPETFDIERRLESWGEIG